MKSSQSKVRHRERAIVDLSPEAVEARMEAFIERTLSRATNAARLRLLDDPVRTPITPGATDRVSTPERKAGLYPP